MRILVDKKCGFTLTELLTAIALFVVTVVPFLAVLNMCNYMASYSKHRVQAAYVAKRILEEQRRQTFSTITTQTYGPVSIDTKGTFNSPDDDYMGNAFITVTGLDAYRKRVQVEVDWQERTPVGSAIKKEFCATDIANDPQLN